MKYCEKCDKKGAKYVEKYNGYLCDFHAQCWLLVNEKNERNGIKLWYEYLDTEIDKELDELEEEY